MLIINKVNYDKNYVTIEVKESGEYFISKNLTFNKAGNYDVHLPYEIIKTLKQHQVIKPIKKIKN